jgi:hypothetical protein
MGGSEFMVLGEKARESFGVRTPALSATFSSTESSSMAWVRTLSPTTPEEESSGSIRFASLSTAVLMLGEAYPTFASLTVLSDTIDAIVLNPLLLPIGSTPVNALLLMRGKILHELDEWRVAKFVYSPVNRREGERGRFKQSFGKTAVVCVEFRCRTANF